MIFVILFAIFFMIFMVFFRFFGHQRFVGAGFYRLQNLAKY